MTVIDTELDASRGIELVGHQSLTIRRKHKGDAPEDIIELLAPNGITTLTIRVTPEGAQIELGAASLALKVTGDLSFDANKISLNAREGINLTTASDLTIKAANKLVATAHTQQLTATRGNISVYANDDVKIDGERIRMNC